MAPPHEGGGGRHDIKQGAEAELLLDEPSYCPALGPEQRRVEEKLAWVVTRLAMDVHRAGEVGRQLIIEPVGISKPGIRPRQDDKLAGAGVIEPDLMPLWPR